jgi:diacylglycerol kinase family enzyme
MSVTVLMNQRAGSGGMFLRLKRGFGGDGDDVSAVGCALRRAGIEAEVHAVRPPLLADAARDAANSAAKIIVAAGGDGTINTVAGALVGTQKILGVLPTGTRNHFARDLGLPGDLDAAARIVASGSAVAVDVAEINGRIFLNNSSIGLYPHAVRHREEQRLRFGRSKPMAMLWAAIGVFRRFPQVEIRLRMQDREVARLTPFVFIGNNAYQLNLLELGSRASLNEGRLCVYVTRRGGRFSLLRLMLAALLGRLEQARDFDSWNGSDLVITSPKKHLEVAIDGEVHRIRPPLTYRCRPQALRVLVS